MCYQIVSHFSHICLVKEGKYYILKYFLLLLRIQGNNFNCFVEGGSDSSFERAVLFKYQKRQF